VLQSLPAARRPLPKQVPTLGIAHLTLNPEVTFGEVAFP
jgi:hypothetical protein